MTSSQAVLNENEDVKSPEPVYMRLAASEIVLNMDNPRGKWDRKTEAWKEFVDSIKSGVRVPVQVNKTGKGFMLMAGARRTMAAAEAKLESLPALVYDNLSPEEAFEITFHENFGREDLSPLEEGRAVEILLEMYSGDAEAVASKMGRSVSWVRRRAKLKDLCPIIREAMANPNEAVSKWPAGNLAIISGFPEDTQVALYDHFEYEDNPGIKQIERVAADFMRLLSGAPWALNNQLAGEISCDGCSARTGCHPGLFDDFENVKKVSGDRCLIEACWEKKMQVFVEGKIKEVKKKHKKLELICTAKDGYWSRQSFGNKVLAEGSYKVLKRPGKKPTVPALWVSGPSVGTECQIRLIESDYDRARREETAVISAEKKTPEYKARVKAEKLDKARDVWMAQVLVDNLYDSPGKVDLGIEVPPINDLLKLLALVALHERCYSDNLDCEYEDDLVTDDVAETAWEIIKGTLSNMLKIGMSGNIRFLVEIGVDIEDLKTKAIEAIPEK